ncbi:hypothetical protein MMC25_000739 [Agyrium rufum]|nr:hypothetical protein [Agyrium rufum]
MGSLDSHKYTKSPPSWPGVSLSDLPKSNIFTSSLPADAKFPTPASSHKASHDELGPRQIRNALFTYVRPEEKEEPQLLGVSRRAMKDIGIKEGEEEIELFKDVAAGNKIFWDEEKQAGVYPWAQCYGGWQFGNWAGQLGDGRAISLFESTNPDTKVRYEIQLKGGGVTPYSRFADGKAVLRSSVREFVASEALNALNIPSTRALALTLTPHTKVRRETIEPGAIVTRFAQSWLRIGTFDIMRARGDRDLIRKTATYLAENIFGGWSNLPFKAFTSDDTTSPQLVQNRFAHLYRHIVRLNALTVAKWQAYAFTNGVLNTDNTSLMGLSLDFGPFAFLDNFDPNYTPNHDDHMLRYSYKNQPSVIWWNLVRLGESLGELIGAGDRVDEEDFRTKGVSEDWTEELIERAESIISQTGDEYKAVFLEEYTRLMRLRLGLTTSKESDFKELFSELLDTLEALELDFNHFFRRLSSINLSEIDTPEQRKDVAAHFFHSEGISALGVSDVEARERVAIWLEAWRARILSESPSEEFNNDEEKSRQTRMKAVNPNFIPRGWVLDEIIKSLSPPGFSTPAISYGQASGRPNGVSANEKQAVPRPDTTMLEYVMSMVEEPFRDEWEDRGVPKSVTERWCGDVPRLGRGLMCSCSS